VTDTVLWAIALGIGALGLLLLALAGVAAAYLTARSQRLQRDTDEREDEGQLSQQRKSVETPQAQGDGPGVAAGRSQTDGALWAWLKAGVFASIHALVVSIILGGVTFFEDIVRANDEIQRTGTVTFPPQLLPAVLSNSPDRGRITPASGDSARYEVADDKLADVDEPEATLPDDNAEWRVVPPSS
jgi:hypothetical protein